MPYTQTFGFSRTSSVVGGNSLSPLNKLTEEVVENTKKVDIDPEIDINKDKDIIVQNNEKFARDRSNIDKFQDALSLGGLVNPLADIANTVISGGRMISNFSKGNTEEGLKHLKNMGIYGFSAIPGFGDVFAAGNMINKGGRIMKNISKVKPYSEVVTKYEAAVGADNFIGDETGTNPSEIAKKKFTKSLTNIPSVISTGFGPKVASFFITPNEENSEKVTQPTTKKRMTIPSGNPMTIANKYGL